MVTMPVHKYQTIGPFTINNPTEEDFNYVRTAVSNYFCKYLVFCHENQDLEGHTYHLQGYASSAKGPYSIKKWHSILGPRFALDPKFSGIRDHPACIQYCKGLKLNPETNIYEKKEGSGEFEEFGELKQGSRTDIHEAVAAIANGKRTYDAIIEHPGAIQCYKALQDLERETKKRRALQEVQSEYTNITWKPWQQGILDSISQPADNRTVTWLYEETGNVGKTTITRYLASTGKAYTPDISKIADMYYGYNYEPVIIFDIPRSKKEHMEHLYTAIEQFKNGSFSSTKYEPRHMLFRSPHLIVFANFQPELQQLSKDRWNIINISDPVQENNKKRKAEDPEDNLDPEERMTLKEQFLKDKSPDSYPKNPTGFKKWKENRQAKADELWVAPV